MILTLPIISESSFFGDSWASFGEGEIAPVEIPMQTFFMLSQDTRAETFIFYFILYLYIVMLLVYVIRICCAFWVLYIICVYVPSVAKV